MPNLTNNCAFLFHHAPFPFPIVNLYQALNFTQS